MLPRLAYKLEEDDEEEEEEFNRVVALFISFLNSIAK